MQQHKANQSALHTVRVSVSLCTVTQQGDCSCVDCSGDLAVWSSRWAWQCRQLALRKRHPLVLQQPLAKMRDRSQLLCTAESTVIVIAAAGGGTAVVTAAASATGADVQGDGSLRTWRVSRISRARRLPLRNCRAQRQRCSVMGASSTTRTYLQVQSTSLAPCAPPTHVAVFPSGHVTEQD